ncbi:hypothetical protein ABZS61_30660 [Streptomyces sp. NPDC005566]|uniref:hypothetical protein n=1 Tax=Streptomyces sp. NPDC005566 TaxID=3156886 RepID=UPI0033A18BEC
MADEQYEWLDADAAEILLRGESVEPVDDHARDEARRLEAALRSARTPRPSGAELPGEATVLAAFRETSRARKRDGAVRAGIAGEQDALHAVRIGATRSAPSRRPRWSRPVRYGLAVSLAGCALGGVAVAAGTGVLPAPFGGQFSPVPATSVSAASPEELGAELPDSGRPSPLPSGSPASPDASGTPGGAATGTDPGDGPAGEDGSGTGSGTDRGDGDRDGSADQDGSEGGGAGRETPDGSGGPVGSDGTDSEKARELYERSVRACRAYREGTLSAASERWLIRLAKGERNLDRFCDRLLDGDGSSGGDGPDGGEGGKDPGDGSEGSLPSISFRTPPAQDEPQDGSDMRSSSTDAASSAR